MLNVRSEVPHKLGKRIREQLVTLRCYAALLGSPRFGFGDPSRGIVYGLKVLTAVLCGTRVCSSGPSISLSCPLAHLLGGLADAVAVATVGLVAKMALLLGGCVGLLDLLSLKSHC